MPSFPPRWPRWLPVIPTTAPRSSKRKGVAISAIRAVSVSGPCPRPYSNLSCGWGTWIASGSTSRSSPSRLPTSTITSPPRWASTSPSSRTMPSPRSAPPDPTASTSSPPFLSRMWTRPWGRSSGWRTIPGCEASRSGPTWTESTWTIPVSPRCGGSWNAAICRCGSIPISARSPAPTGSVSITCRT